MTGTLTELVVAVAAMIVSHFAISSTGLRAGLITKLGEKAYLGLYSLLSLVLFVWIIYAYRHAPTFPLWDATQTHHWIAVVLIAPASILYVVGLASPNPTAVGADQKLLAAGAVGIFRITRHPFLWGTALWAIAHMVSNGEGSALVLFGGMAALALIGTRMIDAKKTVALGAAWENFAARTSNLPFAAIAAGRNHLAVGEIGAGRLLGGVGLYIVLLIVHHYIFGVSPLPF